jgi:tRNA-dihydrouridine synthase B
LKPVFIGSLKIDVPIGLGPMAGVTDSVFRRLCRRQGCGFLYTEMVSAKAVLYGNRGTDALIAFRREEQPLGVQLFGRDPQILAEIAKRMEAEGFSFIDVNMGCPVPKIVKNGEGSALMKDPVLVGKIVEAMAGAVKVPVTVKIRAGFSPECLNAPEVAYAAQESGAAAVAVHGRTREQYYAGKADYEVIRRVKERVNIPVFGNGDVTDGPSAARLLEESGCDGILVARAARGNPWIFREILEYLKTGRQIPKPSLQERCRMMLEHARMLTEEKGEYIGIREMRKHFGWYTAGIRGASHLRAEANGLETLEQMENLVNRLQSGAAD